MWSPFRNEIWTSLTLAEGVAMPYALLGLVAAVRAARAEQRASRILWDSTAVCGALMALGCKNVFVALIPAQIALRLCPEGWNLRQDVRANGWRPLTLLLPMDGFAGAYTMPAVWGLDVLIAVVLAHVLGMPALMWKRAAGGAFAVGLFAVAVSNVGRQQKFAARADMLWQALVWVEKQPLPPGAVVGWVSDSATSTGGKVAYTAATPGLNIEEGIHFDWHLRARHRADRVVRLFDENGRPQDRVEITVTRDGAAAVVVTAFDA